MTRTIGVLATEHIAVGLVEEHKLVGAVRRFPETESAADQLGNMPAQEIVQALAEQIAVVAVEHDVAGNGVGFGRYPIAEGYWEGGHTVVTLDPKENFCGCGGRGHLEGIMGNNAIRRRFLDLEPEEVFAHAQSGDERCAAFVTLYHRALAAATATQIHMEGPGQFFISGPNAKYVQLNLLETYLHEMIKMSPLQGSKLEVVTTTDETVIVGAAVTAAQAATI